MKYIGFNILTITIILIIGFICSIVLFPYFYFPEEKAKMEYWNSHNGCYIKNDIPCSMIPLGEYPDIPLPNTLSIHRIIVKNINPPMILSLYHCDVYGINNEIYKVIKQSDCSILQENKTYIIELRVDEHGSQTSYVNNVTLLK
jgi:hypothetical protein